MSDFHRYHEAVRYLESLGNISSSEFLHDRRDPSIFVKRSRHFLDLLGSPDKEQRFIHITGTSGKGSVASMVHSGLLSKGISSGLFTSPFSQESIEKIKVDDLYISPSEFAEIVDSIKPAIDKASLSEYGSPSYFEAFFAIALLYFRKRKCKYSVIEVGLGGRYDATNAIGSPAVSAITNIGLDHVDVLGDTKEKIANDKAGIIKQGSIFWTSEEENMLLDIFKHECKAKGASFNEADVEGLDFSQKNRLLAMNILQSLGHDGARISDMLLMPCRFEIMQRSPAVILDGAHNPDKIRSVLSNLKKTIYEKLHLVFTASKDKDHGKMLSILSPLASRITITRTLNPFRKCAIPKEMLFFAEKSAPSADMKVILDPHQALQDAIAASSPDDLILCTGSFFLTGELRCRWHPNLEILEKRKSW